jgi:hypothetical protein
MVDNPFDQWLAKCRNASPPEALVDQIMSQVANLEHQRRDTWRSRLIPRIEHSPAARWAVCGGALAIGGSPFVFLAYVAQLLTF